MKAEDYYKVVSFDGRKMVVEFNIEAPSEANRSKGTATVVDGKEVKNRDGKSFVIGRAFGKLPFSIKGVQLKINCSIMLPIEGISKTVTEVTIPSRIPPVIAPAQSQEAA